MPRISSPFTSFVFSGMLLLAAISPLALTAPTRMSLDRHHVSHYHVGRHNAYLARRQENGTEDTNDTPTTDDDEFSSVVASGWYAYWEKERLPVAQIPWKRFNELTFAFAITEPDGTLRIDDKETLREFAQEAKKNNVSALISIGGFTGSKFFSTAVGTPENRTSFIKEIVTIVNQYELDGVDFDWEYPHGTEETGLGLPCNKRTSSDTTNFLLFLQELRNDPVGKDMRLTAATHISPFRGEDASVPLSDVSDFAEVLDHIAIMAYDLAGSWSSAIGANAPLRSNCPASPSGSVESAVAAWTAAGFPPNQILLAVGAYGRSFAVPEDRILDSTGNIVTLNSSFDGILPGEGEPETGPFGKDECTGQDLTTPGGVFSYNGLIASGYLSASGEPVDDVAYLYDNCTETPFLYHRGEGRMISYDNVKSFAAKGNFIKEQNLGGFAVWSIAGDTRDSRLVTSLWDSIGITESEEECENVE